MTHRKQQKW